MYYCEAVNLVSWYSVDCAWSISGYVNPVSSLSSGTGDCRPNTHCWYCLFCGILEFQQIENQIIDTFNYMKRTKLIKEDCSHAWTNLN